MELTATIYILMSVSSVTVHVMVVLLIGIHVCFVLKDVSKQVL